MRAREIDSGILFAHVPGAGLHFAMAFHVGLNRPLTCAPMPLDHPERPETVAAAQDVVAEHAEELQDAGFESITYDATGSPKQMGRMAPTAVQYALHWADPSSDNAEIPRFSALNSETQE